MLGLLFNLYVLGCLVAFGMAFVDAHYSEKRNENIDDFCAMVVLVTLMSWFYVYSVIKRIRKN